MVAATNCSASPDLKALFVLSSTGGAAALVCLLAAVVVFATRLHTTTLDCRLALYHVLAGLVSGIACVCQLLSVLYYDEPVSATHAGCTAVAFLLHYSLWMKLCFNGWTILHLFCYAVCYRNPHKLEAVYVLTSIAIPAAISAIPVATRSYGLAGAWCWIKSGNECSLDKEIDLKRLTMQQLALWNAPAAGMVALGLISVLAVVTILVCRSYAEKIDRERAILVIKPSTINTSALNQIFPLLVNIVTWCLLVIPSMLNHVYGGHLIVSQSLVLADALCTPAWSIAAGVTMVIHVILVLNCRMAPDAEQARRYGTIAEERDFANSAVFHSTDTANWSSSFHSTVTSCQLANWNAASGHVIHS